MEKALKRIDIAFGGLLVTADFGLVGEEHAEHAANLIGTKWHTGGISRLLQALQQDFSSHADLARKQRLAVAHIRTEEICEAELARRLAASGDDAARWLYSPDALTWLHQALFSGLPPADLLLADQEASLPLQDREPL